MRALVTGATGQVGSYIVERLAADGWSVCALVRDPARASWLEPLGAELHAGDVLNGESFRRAASGCDAIFHTAAAITPKGGWETFRRTNIDGTQIAIDAAATAGAKLVQISSVAVYGSGTRYREAPTDEDVPLPTLPEGAYYARSKRESEQMVLNAHHAGKLWACAVRPDVIYGRRDRQFVPRVAGLMRYGVMPLINGGSSRLAIVHAGNVADGAVRAIAAPMAGGNAYNLANDFDVTVADFVRLASEGLGKKLVTVSIPLSLARAGMAVVKGAVSLVRGREMASHANSTLSFMSRDNPFSSERARRELGWDPPYRPQASIPEAFRWYRDNKAD
ncbi:MAG: NAD-dependent epimerase/dehydratase family protein [Anaerolineae bacterium]|nr:NAD-dependent epimerase/dehydratase family protein [Gemmatimonadaceae bacterium]